jgi:opacity protein-like surface antigen
MFKRIALAVAVLASTISVAQANDTILRANNQVSFSVGAHNLDYRELDRTGVTGGGDLDSEKGTQAAFEAAIRRQGDVFGFHNIYTSVAVDVSRGHTNYDGYLQSLDGASGLIPFKNSTTNTTTDVIVKVGKGFALGQRAQAQVTPYLQYGFHNWVRDMQGEYGYKETYSHHTLGGGVMGQYAFTNRIVGSVDANASATINPKMSTALFGGDFKLKTKAVESVSVGVDYALTDRLHANASYRFTHFEYGQSGVNGGAYEPDSKTNEHLFLVGLGYSF